MTLYIHSFAYWLLKAREKPGVQGWIGFSFASHWLKNGSTIFKPITKRVATVVYTADRLAQHRTNAREIVGSKILTNTQGF